ncbi:MAG: formate dehydrogenase accessory sulfurtransferase FdhD [Acidaminobacteraceae bacterium]
MDTSKKVKIIKYKDGVSNVVEDDVIIEFPLTLYLRGNQYATLLCTPEYEKELIVGYLFSENLINKKKDIKSISIDLRSGEVFVDIIDENILESDINKKRLITSGCANNTVFYNAIDKIKLQSTKNKEQINLDMESLLDTMANMNKSSELFLRTGGVHMSLLSDGKDFNVFREDIGRHNAIDKIVGHIILNEVSCKDKILFSSGRLSSEMLLKSAKIGIEVIVSKSAPMDMAIRIADELGIVLIGFARGKRCNIYSGFDLI